MISVTFDGYNLRKARKHLLLAALLATAGNKTHAAQLLGISIRSLRNYLDEFRLSHLKGNIKVDQDGRLTAHGGAIHAARSSNRGRY